MIKVFGLFFVQVLGVLADVRFNEKFYPIPYQYQNEDYARNMFPNSLNNMMPGQIQTDVSNPSMPSSLLNPMPAAVENLLYIPMQEDSNYRQMIPPYPVVHNVPIVDSRFQPNNMLPYQHHPYANDYFDRIFYPNGVHDLAAMNSPMFTKSIPLPAKWKPSNTLESSSNVENVRKAIKVEKNPLADELYRLITNYYARKSPNMKTNITMKNTRVQSVSIESKDPLSEELTRLMNKYHRKKITQTTERGGGNLAAKDTHKVVESSATSVPYISDKSTAKPFDMFATINRNNIVSTTPLNLIEKNQSHLERDAENETEECRKSELNGTVDEAVESTTRIINRLESYSTEEIRSIEGAKLDHTLSTSTVPEIDHSSSTTEGAKSIDQSTFDMELEIENYRKLDLNGTDDEAVEITTIGIERQDESVNNASHLTTDFISSTISSLPESNQSSRIEVDESIDQSTVIMEAETENIKKLDLNGTNDVFTTPDTSKYENLVDYIFNSSSSGLNSSPFSFLMTMMKRSNQQSTESTTEHENGSHGHSDVFGKDLHGNKCVKEVMKFDNAEYILYTCKDDSYNDGKEKVVTMSTRKNDYTYYTDELPSTTDAVLSA